MTEAEFPFLSVDRYLADMTAAHALRSALQFGIIDGLQTQSRTLAQLQTKLGGDRLGCRLLLNLLKGAGVVTEQASGFALTAEFHAALRYRDLLEAKLDFANRVAPDVHNLFDALIADPARFQREARIFDLFGYHRSLEATPENHARTKEWMRFTTVLTRYEAQACIKRHDPRGYRTMLDIGGNSGEFAVQLCRANPDLYATILDLPVVCDVGEEHVRGQPEATRVRFLRGNALTDALPTGFDLVTFKSMLHDWPEVDAKRFINRASQALAPGGTLLIFERGPFEEEMAPYHLLPMLLFFRSFRSPAFYRDHLEAVGFADVRVQTIQLEMPFFLVTGRLSAV